MSIETAIAQADRIDRANAREDAHRRRTSKAARAARRAHRRDR